VRRALPAIIVSAGGLAGLLRLQGFIDAGSSTVAIGDDPAASATTTMSTGAGPDPASPPGATTTAVAPPPSTTASPGAPPAGPPSTNAARTVKGPVVTHRFGPVEVQATISGTRITDVKTLQSPGGSNRSTRISENALPKLRQQALSTQGAKNVATVTGATLTSDAFRQSLQGALDSAGFHA
jgi:hypothetical protein